MANGRTNRMKFEASASVSGSFSSGCLKLLWPCGALCTFSEVNIFKTISTKLHCKKGWLALDKQSS